MPEISLEVPKEALMPTFTVEAVDPAGKRIRADIEANSANDAIVKLKSRGYKPMKVNVIEPPVPAAEPAAVPGGLGAGSGTPAAQQPGPGSAESSNCASSSSLISPRTTDASASIRSV